MSIRPDRNSHGPPVARRAGGSLAAARPGEAEGPLSILRWPLAGGPLATAIDAFDVALVEGLARVFGESPEFGPLYPQIDQWLDTCYLSLELVVTRRWTDALLRRAALVLFAWRIAGVVLFELTSIRQVLVVFRTCSRPSTSTS